MKGNSQGEHLIIIRDTFICQQILGGQEAGSPSGSHAKSKQVNRSVNNGGKRLFIREPGGHVQPWKIQLDFKKWPAVSLVCDNGVHTGLVVMPAEHVCRMQRGRRPWPGSPAPCWWHMISERRRAHPPAHPQLTLPLSFLGSPP